MLGLRHDASFREIEAAYWRRASEKRELIPRLNEAYEVLGNAERRHAYDVECGAVTPVEPACSEDQGKARHHAPGVREKLNWFLR